MSIEKTRLSQVTSQFLKAGREMGYEIRDASQDGPLTNGNIIYSLLPDLVRFTLEQKSVFQSAHCRPLQFNSKRIIAFETLKNIINININTCSMQ